MFRAGIHTQTGGPYFRAGTNTGNGWATLLRSKVLWLVCWFVNLLIVPTVFHMPINRLGVHLKCAWSGDHVATCDRVDDQSLGRSYDTFPGSYTCISHDPKVVKMSCDQTCDRSCDSFPGSCGRGVDPTMWLYFSLGAALGELGLGILWMHDVADSILDTQLPLKTTCMSWGVLPMITKMKNNMTSCMVATGIGGAWCYIPVLPPLFFYFPLPFQLCNLMSHGPSPDLSHDFHHMTTLIVLTSYCFIAHCLPY